MLLEELLVELTNVQGYAETCLEVRKLFHALRDDLKPAGAGATMQMPWPVQKSLQPALHQNSQAGASGPKSLPTCEPPPPPVPMQQPDPPDPMPAQSQQPPQPRVVTNLLQEADQMLMLSGRYCYSGATQPSWICPFEELIQSIQDRTRRRRDTGFRKGQ